MSHSTDAILQPLAISVIIDHKVKAVEETAFVEQAQGLLEFFGQPFLSENELMQWFAGQESELRDQLWDKGGNTLVLRALAAFKDTAECEAIFDAMVAISLADRQYVTEESRLIKSAAAIYGFPLPPLKVDRSA